jgi:hypothetical protein
MNKGLGNRDSHGREGRARFSRVFMTALAVVVVGALASSGVGYAASGASQAGTAPKTSAQGQYDSAKAVQPVTQVKGVKVTSKSAAPKPVATSSTLPFTGVSLLGIVVLGCATVAVGFALRRRQSGE